MFGLALKMLFGDTAKCLMLVAGLFFKTFLIVQQASVFCGLLGTAAFAYAAIERQQPPFVMPWQIPVVTFAVIQLICMVPALLGIVRLSLYEPAILHSFPQS